MAKKKIALIVAAIATTAAIAVGTTLAFFTSTDKVSNTFTVGNVNITMDEAKVTKTGNEFVAGTERVKENTYPAIYPGAVIPKDPTITVLADSEDCYVGAVVTINNWLSIPTDLQAKLSVIVPGKDWSIISGTANIKDNTFVIKYKYNNLVSKATTVQVLTPVFTGFTIPSTLSQDDMKAMAADGFKIDVKGGAIQAQGFEDVNTAMAELLK